MQLDDKYLLEEGTIALSGVQALVRLPLDQHRADRRAGLNTATLISGYRGSPLGGYDSALAAVRKILDQHQVTFLPGVNEDLGATAVFGAQLANLLPQPKYDGVLGIWYGKGPGVDRSGDAFRHANLTGVGRHGGVLGRRGRRPGIEVVDGAVRIGGGAVRRPDAGALSRGRAGSARSGAQGIRPLPLLRTLGRDSSSPPTWRTSSRRRWSRRPGRIGCGPSSNSPGSRGSRPRVTRCSRRTTWTWSRSSGRAGSRRPRHFGAANGLNRVVVDSPGAWIGIVAAGKTYLDLREALTRLDLSEDDLRRLGIRILRVEMLYPLDPATLQAVRDRPRGSARHRREALLSRAAGARRAVQHGRSAPRGRQARRAGANPGSGAR